jgi:hypothetical protein
VKVGACVGMRGFVNLFEVTQRKNRSTWESIGNICCQNFLTSLIFRYPTFQNHSNLVKSLILEGNNKGGTTQAPPDARCSDACPEQARCVPNK